MVPAKIHVMNHDPGEREASVPGVEGEPRPDNRLPAVMSSARAGKDPRSELRGISNPRAGLPSARMPWRLPRPDESLNILGLRWRAKCEISGLVVRHLVLGIEGEDAPLDQLGQQLVLSSLVQFAAKGRVDVGQQAGFIFGPRRRIVF